MNIYDEQVFDQLKIKSKCFVGCEFRKCTFRSAEFIDCDFSYAVFIDCDFYNAQFDNSVFYFAQINCCDATKASFEKSYLHGIRIHNTCILYTEFGTEFKISKERKRRPFNCTDFKILDNEELYPSIEELEDTNTGISCQNSNINIQFIDNSSEDVHRNWRRKSYIAKAIQKILEENNYNDTALDYYYYYRQFKRKASENIYFKIKDYLFGQLIWGYGVKVKNFIITYFLNVFVFSFIYSFLPIINKSSGIFYTDSILSPFSEGFSFISYLRVLYHTFLISTISAYGNFNILGIAKIFVVFQIIISIVYLGMGVSVITKRLSNI